MIKNERPGPTRRQRIARALQAALCAVMLAAQPLATVPVLSAATVVSLVAHPAEARKSSSSGGYFKPSRSGSSPSRTPSFSGSSSSSGSGYTRPGTTTTSPSTSGSASDRAASRSQSRSAFDSFFTPAPRSPDITPNRNATTGNTTTGNSGSNWGPSYRNDVRTPSYDQRNNYYNSQGYQPPLYATRGPSSFGVFNAVMFWFLLDSLSNRSHAEFFSNNRNDPSYLAWRQEADKLAADNADLKAKLAALDGQMAAIPAVPGKAGQLPPDVPAAAALVNPPSGKVHWLFPLLTLLVVAGLGYMAWRMTRRDQTGPAAGTPKAVGGDGSALGAAAAILRNKASGARYQPELFRVGMPMTLDPTPFILAGSAVKVTAPEPDSGSGNLVVDAVGTVSDGAGSYHRLYLGNEGGLFQIVTGANGVPSECRYFSRIDEIQPASRDEWGFWLDDQEGMIGWPEFETKDGQLYQRLWSPGDSHVAPRLMTETIETLDGKVERKLRLMLYARSTGLKAPSPTQEYLLVTAVDAPAGAWVELHAGLDINPSALSLS